MLAEQTQKWFPTHVQVTVLQAKDLKPKGKSGTNDTYTIIQLGKEKYSTSVAEKTLDPVWKEEASFELPGLLMEGNSEKYILYLIVMHRSLVGLDKFLGQVAINLNEIFEDKLRRKTEWFNLESKQGKRTKDRGEIKVTLEKIKSGTVGNTYLFRHQLESVGSVDESGNLKSPHRRTLSADTSKVNQLNSTVDDSDSAFGAQNDPFTNVSATLPQKFATLPRQKNPFEESPVSWDQNIGLFLKPTELKKDIKREKKEKVSLFERVTGKKDSKRSDRLSNGGSDGPTDLKSPSCLGENHQDSFDFDSTNPFMTNFKPTSMLPSYSFNVNPANAEDNQKAMEGNPFDAASGYRNLTYEEILQELVKHKEQLKKKDTHIRELEDYIDNLLVRVMEETPSILRVPYEPSRRAGKFAKS
ncbi:rab11 family-interacting protein 2 isoform X2 [Sceloporus undulatus]|uniref:rab11 family-interacting protein 2 isoform X2 n=1 Tax=Sceloporus undulatus TaxID=8520 RepID=UPI001C4BD675|nr:rab11 family-interacting protein 2 isoform X2 [Sceloporus undulatus]